MGKSKPRVYLLVAVWAAFLPVISLHPEAAAALPAPTDVTLDEAVNRAMRESPVVKNAQMEFNRAKTDAKNSWSWALRAFGANIGIVPTIGNQVWAANAGLNVTLNLGDLLVGGPAAMSNSQNQVTVAQNNFERARLEVAAQVAAAHAAYIASKRVLALRRDAEAAAKQDETAVKREFGSGNATGADVRRARVAWSQSAADTATAESDLNRTWAALLAAMGEGAWLDRQAEGTIR